MEKRNACAIREMEFAQCKLRVAIRAEEQYAGQEGQCVKTAQTSTLCTRSWPKHLR